MTGMVDSVLQECKMRIKLRVRRFAQSIVDFLSVNKIEIQDKKQLRKNLQEYITKITEQSEGLPCFICGYVRKRKINSFTEAMHKSLLLAQMALAKKHGREQWKLDSKSVENGQ